MLWTLKHLNPLSPDYSTGRKSRRKVPYFDSSGMWTDAKRLEKGRFDWPQSREGATKLALSTTEFVALVGGLELTQTLAKIWWRKKAAKMAQIIDWKRN